MYIARIRIQNFRCFKDLTVEFNPGVNVIIGENNAGKTALLRALGLIFDREHRPRLGRYDFYQGIEASSEPPAIDVSVTLRSSRGDTLEDKALVATWLTKLEPPWEATLTFRFFLPEEERERFRKAVGQSPGKDTFWRALEEDYLPKYVSRIYGGNPDSQVQAEPEWLNKFGYQFLDAIRDVESQLFSGTNPMLRSMLNQVLDLRAREAKPDSKQHAEDKLSETRVRFRNAAGDLKKNLVDRMDTKRLFELVRETGAEDAGEPDLGGAIQENDLIGALKLFIKGRGLEVPATHNGLGYNNLLYMSLVLASLDLKASSELSGENAILFPLLLIEEPEAHLHPALQYKLLKYLQQRGEPGRDRQEADKDSHYSRQVFITTHSTHITAAVDLDSIICMSAADAETDIGVAYPGRVFGQNAEGRKSKKYVERFLDATKSNMLFAKGVIFVEGLAEQLLLPCFAEYIGSPLEEKHIAVIAVGGSTFKHFLPIFGAGALNDNKGSALRRRVACLVDGDPSRKKRAATSPRWKSCRSYQLVRKANEYEYRPVSYVVDKLKELCDAKNDIRVFHGRNTLEYDLAEANPCTPILITDACAHAAELRAFLEPPQATDCALQDLLDGEESTAIEELRDPTAQHAARFASYYVRCIGDHKGEHAFDLERELRENLSSRDGTRQSFTVPQHIADAIRWACRSGQDQPTP